MSQMILLVDNELKELDRIGSELMMRKYKVLIAYDAVTAIDLLLKNPVELLIADINLSDKDGFYLTEQVRKIIKYQKLPILLLDSQCNNETLDRGKQYDVLLHIPKPVNIPKLVETVSNVFSKSGDIAVKTKEIREREILRLLSVLIVDDEEHIRNILSEYLHQLVKYIGTASSVDEAVEAIKNHTFDIIVTDIKMRDKSGFDLITWVNINPELAGVPVIMMTGIMKNIESVKRAKQLCIDRFLVKPFDLTTIKNTLLEIGIKQYRYNKLVKFKSYIKEQENISNQEESSVLNTLRKKIIEAKKEQNKLGRQLLRVSQEKHSKETADLIQKKADVDASVSMLQDELVEQKKMYFERKKLFANIKRLNIRRAEMLREE